MWKSVWFEICEAVARHDGDEADDEAGELPVSLGTARAMPKVIDGSHGVPWWLRVRKW